MADDRIFLVHRGTKKAVCLGKRYETWAAGVADGLTAKLRAFFDDIEIGCGPTSELYLGFESDPEFTHWRGEDGVLYGEGAMTGHDDAPSKEMTPEERASECCSWWGIEGPGRINDVTRAIRAAENDALERAAKAANWYAVNAPYGDAKHATVGEHIRALKHNGAD